MKPAAVARDALSTHPILVGLSDQERAHILSCGEVVTYAPGELLSREGEPARHYWLLCSGSVRVFYTSPQGLEVTVKIFAAPAAWAEMELLTDHTHIEDCEAVDRSVVVRLGKAAFVRLLEAHPRFVLNVLFDTSARFLIAAQHERALAFLSVEQRLANLLLAYVRIYGVPMSDGMGIRVKLSHAELANGLGVAKRSVTRTLTGWVRQGVLKKAGVSYVVRDLQSLAGFAAKEMVGLDWVSGTPVSSGRGVGPRRRT